MFSNGITLQCTSQRLKQHRRNHIHPKNDRQPRRRACQLVDHPAIGDGIHRVPKPADHICQNHIPEIFFVFYDILINAQFHTHHLFSNHRFENNLVFDPKPFHTNLLFLIEIKADKISLLRMVKIQVVCKLFLSSFIIFLSPPEF